MSVQQRNQLPIPTAFQRAVELHQRGSLAAAEALYRQILAAMPNHSGALHLLGLIAHHVGENETALDCIRRAIKISPANPSFHNNLGTVLRVQGKLGEAVACYQKAVSLRSDYAEAHNNLGTAFNEQGRVEAAVASYQRALASKDAIEIRSNFARCVQNVAFTRGVDADFRRLLVRAITEPWARPGDLAKAAISVLRADPRTGSCIERAAAAWPRRLPGEELFGPAGVAVVASDPLLRSLLENAQINDEALERFLTMARNAMLAAASNRGAHDGVEDASLMFSAALARQCFVNDYVFCHTDAELAEAQQLRAKLIESIDREEPIPSAWLTSVAAYFPLLSLPGGEGLADRSWPEAVAGLLAQQITEPLEERQLRHSIRRITPIEDDVSLSVQRQYEESPYPRWVKLPVPAAAISIDTYIRQRFPFTLSRPPVTRGDVDILVAGCGTGQESNEIAQEVERARVLAVDLSLSSLGYARRKANELALTNIEYAQADILQLASMGRTFDVITASGVLHHLADPVQGLRTLLLLLRARGLMRVGLYSEAGRQAVVMARKFIAERGYRANAADIRKCRQDLMAAGAGLPFAQLTTSRDFYGMGECRDLLFHVQEQRFTLPQIKDLLRTLGLDFLGFSLKGHLARRYAERFPDDRTQTNLDHWHAFETEFPNTFAGMYQFLVCKSGQA